MGIVKLPEQATLFCAELPSTYFSSATARKRILARPLIQVFDCRLAVQSVPGCI